MEIPIQSNLEVIAISLHTKNPLCICNIYLPDSSNLLLNDLNNIIRQLPKPFLFLGDFNSRNPIWGSNYTDARRKIVEKFLDNEQIILLNTGEHTRHNVANNSFSSIDLSITSSSLAPKTKWKVLTEYNCSDHWPISIELLDQSPQIPFPPKWNTKKPNWELFNDLISQSITENPIEIDSPINQTTINSLTNKFTHTILTAATKAIGKTNHNTKKNLVPWWNHECNESIKRYKRCLNKFKKSNSPLDHIQLKKARAQSRYITKKRKTETWQKYTSSINTNTPSMEVWNKIKAIKGISYHRLPLVLQHNNISLSTPSDITKAFAEVFQKNSSDSNYDPEFATFKDTFEMYTTNEPELDPHPHLNFLNMPFSTSEMLDARSNCNSKSPGPDDIPYSFIKNLPSIGLNQLLQIYNLIWETGFYPDPWRNAIIIPIPKPNKNKFNISNYRPISLISTLSKLLEKMVNKRLTWFLETSKLLPINQCGFRRNHSTLDHLSCLHTDICNAINTKQHLILIALVLEKAYDMVWRNRVLHIIHKWGINGNILTFVKNFLRNRSIQVKAHHNLSNLYPTENGLPQGSVLSVTLFLIAIHDIFLQVQKPTKHLIFADDCYIYCSGININTTREILQNALHTLQEWANKSGFIFSPHKSKGIQFNLNIDTALYLKNTQIPFHKSLRILGLIFDNKLNWTTHLKQLKVACKVKLNVIKTLANHTWGADKKSLLNIYKTLILSQINYGSPIYNTAKPRHLKTLDLIHHEGIRLSIGAFRTSPTESILCYAGEIPLQLIRDKTTLLHCIKRKTTPNHIGHIPLLKKPQPSHQPQCQKKLTTIQDIYSNLCNKMNIHTSVEEKITFQKNPPWLWNIKLSTDLLTLCKHEISHKIIISHFHEIIQSRFPNHSLIYTDASKSENGVGFAVVHNQTTIKHKLPTITNIFTAENYAILEAIKLANSLQTNNFLIISDSLGVLTALKNPWHRSEITQITQSELINTQKTFEFMWVPSHVGIKGNEMADEAASLASNIPHNSIIDKISSYDIFTSVKNKILLSWQHHWDSIPPTNKLKHIKCSMKQWSTPPDLNRRQNIAITRIRIGQTFLTHSFLISKDQSPICNTCQTRITIRHNFEVCPIHESTRTLLNLPLNIKEALNEKHTLKTIKFITKVNLINKI
ncbi:hypothetical protein AGLY_012355 [Aphis glycines]|uniref:RNA-directed DNA polymerase n=1 Tax=Aphis glycines TaxID=307491 RepID=A0A6G0T9V0_APHGL|nr:hypothetical protein AGLY_012355 [Aphis glycines]